MIANSARRERAKVAEASGARENNVRRLRLLARTRTNIAAVASTADNCFPVTIRNLARGGAGLRISGHAVVGDVWCLHLPGGPRVTGTIRWHRLGFCGIEFDREITVGAVIGPDGDGNTPAVRRDATSGPAKVIRDRLDAIVSASNSFAAKISAARLRRQLGRESRVVERACRKQGYSWLTDE